MALLPLAVTWPYSATLSGKTPLPLVRRTSSTLLRLSDLNLEPKNTVSRLSGEGAAVRCSRRVGDLVAIVDRAMDG